MTASGSTVGEAPGRLDLLGGVADYAGALVLEVPTRVTTTVTATTSSGGLVVGPARLAQEELAVLAEQPYDEIRAALTDTPRWTRYPLGVALVLVRHGALAPPSVTLTIESDVPVSLGVSSSAALEVATARALLGEAVDAIDPLDLARWCQEAENHVVAAPCGIMDQVAVAVGRPGAVLPILCRPAAVEPAVPLPRGVEVVGWPSGAAHDVAGDPYGHARTAAFMGKRLAEAVAGETWPWVSAVPEELVAALPDALDGAAFLDRFDDTGDPLSAVDPAATYPVRAATAFGVGEHARTAAALTAVRWGEVGPLAPLLAASHAGYSAMGLGHPATDAIVAEVQDRPGVHGARASGGGSGGTVVVVCDAGALDQAAGEAGVTLIR